MTKKVATTPEKQQEKPADEAGLRTFTLPELGVSVKATDVDDAAKKAKALLKEK